MPPTISCPYCNTTIPLTDATANSSRLRCPRCEEVFPNRQAGRSPSGSGGLVPSAGPAAVEPERVPPDVPTPGTSYSNRSLAAFVLGIMAAMAVVGLSLALWTQQQRRERDHLSAAAVTEPARPPSVPPAEWPALRYLPPGTNVVAAVHVADALREPTGPEVLSYLRVGSLDLGVTSLPRWTGLTLEDIDHVVLGLRVDDRLPRLTLIVRTVRPYDQAKVREALKAQRKVERGRKVLYRFTLGNLPFEPVVWFAGEETLIVALTPQDFDEVPAEPTGELPAPLQELLTRRLTVGTPVWVVGHSEDWGKTVGQLPLEMLPKETRQKLDGVQTFGVWLHCARDIGVNAAFQCADDEAARSLESYLAQRLTAAKDGRHRTEFDTLLAELSRTLVHSQQGPWIDLQARVSAEALRQAFAAAGQ